MITPDNPYKHYLEPNSIAEHDIRRSRMAPETREAEGDWLVKLIQRKLKRER